MHSRDEWNIQGNLSTALGPLVVGFRAPSNIRMDVCECVRETQRERENFGVDSIAAKLACSDTYRFNTIRYTWID